MMLPMRIVIVSGLLFSSGAWAQVCNKAMSQSAPDSRYQLLAGGSEVRDKRTGVIWQRCLLGQQWDGKACTGTEPNFRLAFVLTAAENAQREQNRQFGRFAVAACPSDGCPDRPADQEKEKAARLEWRLPNIKELQSLVEESCSDPSINTNIFPGSPTGAFMTSSMAPSSSGQPNFWTIQFSNGVLRPADGVSGYYPVRLVRRSNNRF